MHICSGLTLQQKRDLHDVELAANPSCRTSHPSVATCTPDHPLPTRSHMTPSPIGQGPSSALVLPSQQPWQESIPQAICSLSTPPRLEPHPLTAHVYKRPASLEQSSPRVAVVTIT